MSKKYIVYGKGSCPYCTMAVSLLEQRGEAYDFVDLQEKATILSEVKSYYDHDTVPIIITKDSEDRWSFVGGYTELESLFGG